MKQFSILLIFCIAIASALARINQRNVATWNMQGSNRQPARGTGDQNKWVSDVQDLLRSVHGISVIALQESGSPPPRAEKLAANQAVPVTNPDGIDVNNVEQYRWDLGSSWRPRYVYIFFLNVRAARVSTAILTTQLPNEIIVHGNTRPRITGLVPRHTLGVRIDNDVYYTLHGISSGNRNEVADTVANIYQYYRNRINGNALQWMIMGDYNRTPDLLVAGIERIEDQNDIDMPGMTISHSGTVTQQSGRNLDYAVCGQVGSAWDLDRNERLFDPLVLTFRSDHGAVIFRAPR